MRVLPKLFPAFGIIGAAGDRPAKRADGFFAMAGLVQKQSQVVVGFGKVRKNCDRPAVRFDRFGYGTALFERVGEVVENI